MKHTETALCTRHQGDWDRVLSKQGKWDALQIGELLIDQNLVPDLILSSSAIRARETASLIAKSFDHRCDVFTTDNLYLAEMDTYYREVRNVPDRVRTLLLIGHDPSLSRLFQVMVERQEVLPPAAVAHLALQIASWKRFGYDTQGNLVELVQACPSFQAFPMPAPHQAQNHIPLSGVR